LLRCVDVIGGSAAPPSLIDGFRRRRPTSGSTS